MSEKNAYEQTFVIGERDLKNESLLDEHPFAVRAWESAWLTILKLEARIRDLESRSHEEGRQ